MKKIAALINIEELENEMPLSEFLKEFENSWNEVNEYAKISEFAEVPIDTSIKEIEDAIVLNRSEKVEEEYSDALQELA